MTPNGAAAAVDNNAVLNRAVLVPALKPTPKKTKFPMAYTLR